MKTLHLLRHFKAVEDQIDGTDHARPLAKKGQKAGKALAEHLAAQNFQVDRVFCSTAQRTRSVWLSDTSGSSRLLPGQGGEIRFPTPRRRKHHLTARRDVRRPPRHALACAPPRRSSSVG